MNTKNCHNYKNDRDSGDDSIEYNNEKEETVGECYMKAFLVLWNNENNNGKNRQEIEKTNCEHFDDIFDHTFFEMSSFEPHEENPL